MQDLLREEGEFACSEKARQGTLQWVRPLLQCLLHKFTPAAVVLLQF